MSNKLKFNLPKKNISNTSHMNGLSLFSGAGGDTIGMKMSGINVTYFSENNKYATQTHLDNFPESKHLSGDIKDISDDVFLNIGKNHKIDIIFAGFPCQGFSHAGKKKSNDPRNELVYEFIRATSLIRPKWIIGENVKGLLGRKGIHPNTHKELPVIDIIVSLFNDIGYKLTYNIINANDVGVPQLRQRLIIVGYRSDDGLYPHINFPVNTGKNNTIRSILKDSLEGAVKYTPNITKKDYSDKYFISTSSSTSTSTSTSVNDVHPNLTRLVKGIRGLTPTERLNNPDMTEYIEDSDLLSYSKRASAYHGEILNPDSPCKTIICSYATCPRLFVGLKDDKGQHYIRCLLPVELAQIQGFPSSHKFVGSNKECIKQIGNAICPQIVHYICNEIVNNKVEFKSYSQKPILDDEINNDSDSDSDSDFK